MKNKKNHFTTSVLLCLAAMALCTAPAASGKPSRGGVPYPTASTVRQLIANINYANDVGGAITFNLAPGATFKLKSGLNSGDGPNGLPVIGSTKPVYLTIIGNGASIERIAVIGRYSNVENPFRLFNVASSSSLTLNQVSVKGGDSGLGGAILNRGSLNVINGSILSGNRGSGIYNAWGTVTVSDSTVSDNYATGGGIYNAGGTVTVNNSILSGNFGFAGAAIYNHGGTLTVSTGTLSGNSARFGGGIYNDAGAVTINGSTLSGNEAFHSDYPWTGGDGGGIYNASGSVTISNSTLTGNTADSWTSGDDYLRFGRGGGIYNNGQVTVQNYSSITGNSISRYGTPTDFIDDVYNVNVLYLDSTSTIGVLSGNPAISF